MRTMLGAATIVILSTISAFGQKVGDIIVVVKDGAELKEGGKVVDKILSGYDLKIEEIKGDLYRVTNKSGISGWVHRNDVVMFDRAIDHFTESIRKKPTVKDYVRRAWIWIAKGEWDNAMRDLDEAVRLDPRDSYALSIRASEWQARGQFDKAIADQTALIRLYTSSKNSPLLVSGAYCDRGRVYKAKGDYDKAIADFDEAIRLDPEGYYFIDRADAWEAKGEYDKAIADRNETIRRSPKIGTWYSFRARTWCLKGEYKKAIADFDESIRIDPNSEQTYHYSAWFRATFPNEKVRDGAKAVADATKACELTGWKGSDSGISFDTLAAAYAESGDFPSAVKWEEKAIQALAERRTPSLARMREFQKMESDYRARLALYKSGKAYRETPKK